MSDVEGKDKKKRIVGLKHDSFYSMPFTTTIHREHMNLQLEELVQPYGSICKESWNGFSEEDPKPIF